MRLIVNATSTPMGAGRPKCIGNWRGYPSAFNPSRQCNYMIFCNTDLNKECVNIISRLSVCIIFLIILIIIQECMD